MQASEMNPGAVVEVPRERLALTLTAHGKKPWRSAGGRYRFSHAEVQGSLDAGEAKMIANGDHVVAVV
jgi:hypothetical protein